MDLINRIEKLEKQNRSLRRAFFFAVTIFAAIPVAMGSRSEIEGVIKARHFFLMDKEGHTVGLWGPTENEDGYELSFDAATGGAGGNVRIVAKKAGAVASVRTGEKPKVILMSGDGDGSVIFESRGELKSLTSN